MMKIEDDSFAFQKKVRDRNWVIGGLVLLIVLLLALIILLCNTELKATIRDFLSFASVLLSIVLSIFAILFSLISSNKIDEQLANVQSAVYKIEKHNDNLNNINNQYLSAFLVIQEKIGAIEAFQNQRGQYKNFENDSNNAILELSGDENQKNITK